MPAFDPAGTLENMSQTAGKGRAMGLKQSVIVMSIVVALLWALELVDGLSNHALDQFGIDPRQLASLPEVFTAPLLHFGWAHLLSNTIPLLVLGTLVLVSGLREFLIVTAVTAISSGLLVWLISPSNSVTLGASGVIFGYLTYLLARGFYTKHWGQLALALVIGLMYGGILWGILPGTAGVSWQAHLGGAIGGLLAARLLHRRLDASPA